MRHIAGTLLAVALVASSAVAQPPAAPPVAAPDPTMAGGREATALGEAAEKTCAEMTNYAPDKLAGMTSEMRALVTREYNSCVAKVGSEAP